MLKEETCRWQCQHCKRITEIKVPADASPSEIMAKRPARCEQCKSTAGFWFRGLDLLKRKI